MSDTPQHKVSLLIDGREIVGWETYEIKVSVTDVPGTFELTMPFDRDAWDLCRPDRQAVVWIDDHAAITGFTDDEDAPPDNEVLAVSGRDLIGRLATESAPSINYGGLDAKTLIERLASPWFASVTYDNFRNRTVMRGKGRKAGTKTRAADQTLVLRTYKKLGTIIEPGQSRLAALDRLLEQAGAIVFASGDGTELIVGTPNYDQDVQFRFFRAAPGSARMAEQNVLEMGVKRSTGDRYSKVVVVGTGTGTDANYGPAVCGRYGEAKNNPSTPDGDGLDFSAPKRLILQRAVQSAGDAQELAGREMGRRDALGDIVTVVARGHGQVISPPFPTIFAPDCLATVEDERTGTNGTYYIVTCVYSSSRDRGEETELTLVRKGAELSR